MNQISDMLAAVSKNTLLPGPCIEQHEQQQLSQPALPYVPDTNPPAPVAGPSSLRITPFSSSVANHSKVANYSHILTSENEHMCTHNSGPYPGKS